jgi:hypothetical protein
MNENTFRDDYDLTVRSIQGTTKGSVGDDAVMIVAFVFTWFKRLVDYVETLRVSKGIKTGANVNPFDLTR